MFIRSFLGFLLAASFACVASAQVPASGTDSADLNALVAHEFGPDFKLAKDFAPMHADLDRDGAEDLILVAISRKPLDSQEEFHYTVADPYGAYFGSAEPRTSSNGFDDSSRCFVILMDWKQEQPGQKYVLVNTPFERVRVGHLKIKRNVTSQVLALEDLAGISASVLWDGKRFRWQPTMR